MRKNSKYLTKQNYTPRTVRLKNTPYKIALPYWFAKGLEFNIGNIRFKYDGLEVIALDKIPDSWLIDLNAAD